MPITSANAPESILGRPNAGMAAYHGRLQSGGRTEKFSSEFDELNFFIAGRPIPPFWSKTGKTEGTRIGASVIQVYFVSPCQFVSGESERSLLLGPVPIRERAALKVEDEGLCRLVDRVRAKVADASLHNSFVLVPTGLAPKVSILLPSSRSV